MIDDDNESIIDEALLLPIKLFETPSFSNEYKYNFSPDKNSIAEGSTKSTSHPKESPLIIK